MKAILFDFADTLVTAVPCWEWPQIVACREQGLTVNRAQVRSAIWRVWGPREGGAHPEASRDEAAYTAWIGAIEEAILRELGLRHDLERATRRVMELQAAPEGYRIFGDVRRSLRALRDQGLRLAIVSNNGWWLPDLVAQLNLADCFDLVITSARVGYRKPHPAIFRHVLRALDVTPSEAIVVGDDYQNDVRGAEGVGMRGIWLRRESSNRPSEASAIRTLRSLPDVIA